MKKLICLIMALSIFSCATLNKKAEFSLLKENESITIKWDTQYKFPKDKKGYLVITNPKTKKTWNIKYQDFFVMQKAYKNWRSVENGDPKITKIDTKGRYIIVTFNYFDNDSKSILSGKFIVDVKYIKGKEFELWFWRIFGSAGWIAFIIVLLLI